MPEGLQAPPERLDRFVPRLEGSNGGSTRSILYAAEDWARCVAEVFQDQRLIGTHVGDPWLVAFTFERNLRLLDLSGLWPTRAEGSAAIGSGDRETARAWSRAMYDAFSDIAGLRYGSAMHAGNTAYAFYDRASRP